MPADKAGPLLCSDATMSANRRINHGHGLLSGVMASLVALAALLPHRWETMGRVDIITAAGLLISFPMLLALVSNTRACKARLGPIVATLCIAVILIFHTAAFVLANDAGWDPAVFGHAMLRIAAVVLFAGAMHLERSPRQVYLIKLYLAIIGVASLIAVLFSFAGTDLGRLLPGLRVLGSGVPGLARASSPIGGPNVTGAVTAFVVPWNLWCALTVRQARWIVMLLLTAAALLLSASKTALVAGVAGVAVFHYFAARQRGLRVPRLWWAALVISGVLFGSTSRLHDLARGTEALTAGGSERVEQWVHAVELMAQRPWLGWGPDFWLLNVRDAFSAHMVFLEVLLDYGLPMGVGLLMCCGALVVSGSATAVRRGVGGMEAAALGSLAALVTGMGGDYTLWEPRMLVLCAVIAGVDFGVLTGCRVADAGDRLVGGRRWGGVNDADSRDQ